MNRGFAGMVAVPAWARFMKAATTGAKPDWYEVPADVEKVAICRLSGHARERRLPTRASPDSRRAAGWRCTVGLADVVAASGRAAAKPRRQAERLRGLLSARHDLARAVPAARRARRIGRRPSVHVGCPRRFRHSPIVIERVPRTDGTIGIAMKGGGH